MLSKQYKLPRALFPKKSSNQKVLFGGFLRIQYTAQRTVTAPPLFAVVISKKISPLATQRNDIRRKIYQTVQLYTHSKELLGKILIIFLIKKEKHPLTRKIIESDIHLFFKEILNEKARS